MVVGEARDYETFAGRHAADWRRLAASSDSATVFQTWEWLHAWAMHHPPRGFLGLTFTENDTLVGLALLERPAPGVLRPLGTGVSDYLDLLAAPGREDAVANAFAGHLWQRRDWLWIDLPQARPGSVAARVPGATRTEGETCPYLPLPADWETFRKGLGKSLRGNIGYYERALARQHRLEMRLADTATFDTDLDAFFALHQRRWRARWMPGAFADRKARAFHRDAARALLEADMLRLHTLLLDDVPRASIYCFQKGPRCAYYLGGFDPDLARLSPGTVLTARAIRHAIERDGAKEFDFLRGNEAYKYRWGAHDRHSARLAITRRGPAQLLASAGRLQLAAELRLKDRMHARHGGAGRPEPSPAGKE